MNLESSATRRQYRQWQSPWALLSPAFASRSTYVPGCHRPGQCSRSTSRSGCAPRCWTDHLGRLFHIHAREPGRPRKQCLGRDREPGGNHSAQVFALRRNHVEGRRGAEVNHNAGTTIASEGRHSVDQPIRAKFGRVVHQDGMPVLIPGSTNIGLILKYRSHTWRRVDSSGGTTEEMMMLEISVASTLRIVKRSRNSTPYSSAVWVLSVLMRQWVTSSSERAGKDRAQYWCCRRRG